MSGLLPINLYTLLRLIVSNVICTFQAWETKIDWKSVEHLTKIELILNLLECVKNFPIYGVEKQLKLNLFFSLTSALKITFNF